MSLCRICLTHTNGECVELFSEHGRSLNMVSILTKYFLFQINENDGTSTIICSVCWNNTNKFHQFYLNVQQAQQKYFKATPTTAPDSDDELSKFPSTNINEFSIKVDDSKILTVTKFDEKKILTIPKEEEKFIKEEIPETIINNSDDIFVENLNGFMFDENNDEPPVTDEDDDYRDDSEKSNNEDNDKNVETKRKKIKTKKTLDLNAEDQKIAEFCQMFCDFCVTEFKTLRQALKHYTDKHQMRGYLICGGVKLNRRNRILNYINRHINPEESHCNLCNKTFCDKEGLKRHMNTHKTEKEKFFRCVRCDKRFANYKSLKNHKLTVHGTDEDRNVACDKCDQKFFTKIQLSAHKKSKHNTATEICEFCGIVFQTKCLLNAHRSETHLGTDSPKIQCNICGTWLKEKYLTKHLKQHTNNVETSEPCNLVLQNRYSYEQQW